MRIGVFDSGVRGLSILKSLYEANLFEEIIHYDDMARAPYGVKDKKTIIKFCLEASGFFKFFKIDMLIIACNAASAYALETLGARADFPIYGVIEVGVRATCKNSEDKDKEILVIAVKATTNSRQYQINLGKEGFTRVKALATGLFVPMVEEGIFEGEFLKSAFLHYFKDVESPDAPILACTHLPLLSKALSEFFGSRTRLIHSGEAIVEFLRESSHSKLLDKRAKLRFFALSDIKSLEKTAKIWLNLS